MSDFASRLKEALDTVPVVDPHCHLQEGHPHARNLAELLLYHHVWIELVSAGMPATAVSKPGLPHELVDPRMASDLRVKACLPYLPLIRNTASTRFLRWLLEDIYGIPGGVLTGENWPAVSRRIEQAAENPDWGYAFLRDRCNIRSSVTVESGKRRAEAGQKEAVPPMVHGREVRPLITLDNAKTSPQQALRSIESALNQAEELRGGEAFAERLSAHAKHLAESDLRCIGIWVPPYLRLTDPAAEEVTRIFERTRQGQMLSHDEQSVFTSFALRRMLEVVRKTRMRTIQVIVGAEVLPPHRALTHWDGAFVGAIGRLAGAFEDLNFDVSAASDAFVHDLAILAKHVPNVSVCGYWWHALYPPLVRKSLELRLDAVPVNKITAFFSDAYHAEWCYPKLKMVKQVFQHVLTERVARGWYDEETALSLIRPMFYENPLRIYYGIS